MFQRTKKTLLSFSIVLCLIAAFIASNRTPAEFDVKARKITTRNIAYAFLVINVEGKKVEFDLKFSASN